MSVKQASSARRVGCLGGAAARGGTRAVRGHVRRDTSAALPQPLGRAPALLLLILSRPSTSAGGTRQSHVPHVARGPARRPQREPPSARPPRRPQRPSRLATASAGPLERVASRLPSAPRQTRSIAAAVPTTPEAIRVCRERELELVPSSMFFPTCTHAERTHNWTLNAQGHVTFLLKAVCVHTDV